MADTPLPLQALRDRNAAEDHAVTGYVRFLAESGELERFVKLFLRAAKFLKGNMPTDFEAPLGGAPRELHELLVFLGHREDYPEEPKDTWTGGKLHRPSEGQRSPCRDGRCRLYTVQPKEAT